jgi:acyl carrier protein
MMKRAVRLFAAFAASVMTITAVDGMATALGSGRVFLASNSAAQSPALFERAQEIIADHFGVALSAVTPDADITQDLGADDLDLIELVMEMEEEFGVELADDQIERIATVGDLLAAVEANGGR